MTKFAPSLRILGTIAVLVSATLFSVMLLIHSPGVSIDAEERHAVLERISEVIIGKYVFPQAAIEMAEHIQNQQNLGAYESIKNSVTYAEQLTSDLQSINGDKHITVFATAHESDDLGDGVSMAKNHQEMLQATNYGFNKAEILEGNVGYLDYRMFEMSVAAKKTGTEAIKTMENSDAIIVDVRRNGGGSPQMVQFISSYFFDEKTHLNSLYWREGNETEEYWTLKKIPGKRMPDVPLFVLISEETFSAAEEFAYNLQALGRAVIVGQISGGGAHPGQVFSINRNFSIFVPTGRAINPITGTNWEGVGVIPNVETEIGEALEEAHILAKIAADQYRKDQVSTE